MGRVATSAIQTLTSSAATAMRGLTRVVCLVIAVAALAACESSIPNAGIAQLSLVAKRFVPPDATEQVVATGVPWEQIDFVVHRGPFTFAFDESEIKSAVADGWLPCRPKSEKWWAKENPAPTWAASWAL